MLGKADYTAAPINKIELKNIGSDKPVSSKQLYMTIYKLLMNEAVRNLDLKNLIPELLLQKVVPVPVIEIKEAGKLLQNFLGPQPQEKKTDEEKK